MIIMILEAWIAYYITVLCTFMILCPGLRKYFSDLSGSATQYLITIRQDMKETVHKRRRAIGGNQPRSGVMWISPGDQPGA
jgi:hypothetical protein